MHSATPLGVDKIVIFANGKPLQVESPISVQKTVLQLKLQPNTILAELNGEVLPRESWEETQLDHGDRLELVRVVAGG